MPSLGREDLVALEQAASLKSDIIDEINGTILTLEAVNYIRNLQFVLWPETIKQ